ncbi:MAG: nucleotidyltransferase [Planctomycetota bacterium]
MKPGDTPSQGLADALQDAVSLFRELKIGYALVGGLAAMVHGRSRYTEDVDFVAEPGHEDVLSDHPGAMKRCGFDPGCTWKLYHRSGVQIDLWKDKHAPGIVDRAVRRKLGDRFVKVADPHDLVAMKLRAGRPQDDYDISEIIKAGAIDEDVLAERATQAQLRRFRAIRKRVSKEG